MTYERLLAQLTVSDLDRAEEWYAVLLGRSPDARPMDGLLEWHLADTFGVQVFAEPDRAGCSAVVLDVSDVDAQAAALTAAGIDHDGVRPVTRSRLLVVNDPDGNRIVISGPLID